MTAPTRCGRCNTCSIEKDGSCACDGACDDGCFLCSPENHTRPPCPAVLLEAVVAERSWAVRF